MELEGSVEKSLWLGAHSLLASQPSASCRRPPGLLCLHFSLWLLTSLEEMEM